MNRSFWQGRRVFLTGHTGFKGSWLSLWLHDLRARVGGFALAPNTEPNLFELCKIGDLVEDRRGDIRNREALHEAVSRFQPEVVIHMAAQPLVRKSYADPLETFETNMMGTAHLLESLRTVKSVRSIVVVTTDKCYENQESKRGYRESDPLGGYDPYSSSKAGTELIANAYRSSFFNPQDYANHKVTIATARAGNVIGGGDWSAERLIPDLLRSIIHSEPLELRNPNSSRPWQHVLEPLHGYLLLAEKLFEHGPTFSGAWNFGPNLGDHIRVEDVITLLQSELATSVPVTKAKGPQPHETNLLRLDSSKARENLDWEPQLSVKESLKLTAQWVRLYLENANMRMVTRGQIGDFLARKAP